MLHLTYRADSCGSGISYTPMAAAILVEASVRASHCETAGKLYKRPIAGAPASTAGLAEDGKNGLGCQALYDQGGSAEWQVPPFADQAAVSIALLPHTRYTTHTPHTAPITVRGLTRRVTDLSSRRRPHLFCLVFLRGSYSCTAGGQSKDNSAVLLAAIGHTPSDVSSRAMNFLALQP